VSKDATPEQLKEFVEGKGVTVIGIEKLKKVDAETRTNSFKGVVKLSDYEKAMKPEVWPYREGVRHYKPPRRNAQGMSRKQQSQQTGGNVNPQEQQQHHQRQQSGRGTGQRAPQMQRQSHYFNLDLSNKF
jgi:hypothetical protein